MNLVGANNWAIYKALIRDAHDTFSKDIVVWKRQASTQVPLYSEGQQETYQDIPLEVLLGYNFFRTWPLTQQLNYGEQDNQNMLMLINRRYLEELNYLTPQGYWDFKPDRDHFIHKGIKYKAEGDTPLSQAYDDPLHIQVILRREENLEGTSQFNQS